MQADFSGLSLSSKLGIPLERKILNAVAPATGIETESPAREIEEVLFPKDSVVEFQEDEISQRRDFANGLARSLPVLGAGL